MSLGETYNDLVIKHYERIWGCSHKIKKWENGPMLNLFKDFCILEYPPTSKRKMWIYATCGMSSMGEKNPIELHIFSAIQDIHLLELLTAISHYHKQDKKLNLNHTVNFGLAWQNDSKCSYGIISFPYLDGPNLELLKIDNKFSIQFLWLIPITQEELDYKKTHGVENLEQKFEFNNLDYLNPCRSSVV